MGNKRTPQTLKKRQRERDKQVKRLDKIARRIERNSAKRQAKLDGPPTGDAQSTDNGDPQITPAPAPESP